MTWIASVMVTVNCIFTTLHWSSTSARHTFLLQQQTPQSLPLLLCEGTPWGYSLWQSDVQIHLPWCHSYFLLEQLLCCLLTFIAVTLSPPIGTTYVRLPEPPLSGRLSIVPGFMWAVLRVGLAEWGGGWLLGLGFSAHGCGDDDWGWLWLFTGGWWLERWGIWELGQWQSWGCLEFSGIRSQIPLPVEL